MFAGSRFHHIRHPYPFPTTSSSPSCCTCLRFSCPKLKGAVTTPLFPTIILAMCQRGPASSSRPDIMPIHHGYEVCGRWWDRGDSKVPAVLKGKWMFSSSFCTLWWPHKHQFPIVQPGYANIRILTWMFSYFCTRVASLRWIGVQTPDSNSHNKIRRKLITTSFYVNFEAPSGAPHWRQEPFYCLSACGLR